MAIPTQARVNEYFNYDPETGHLTHKLRPRSEFRSNATYQRHLNRVGTIAGAENDEGYIRVLIDGFYHPAHKIVWLIQTGEWVFYPENEVDHENGKRSDNRWINLEKKDKSGNQRNAGKRINNTSGVHGVNWKPIGNDEGRWVARIWNGPKHVYLGQFKTLREARIARKAAERVLGFTGSDRDGYAVRKIEAERGAA